VSTGNATPRAPGWNRLPLNLMKTIDEVRSTLSNAPAW